MRYESESVSLYALIQWGLKEHTERQLAALPSQQEIDAVLGDTSSFCQQVLDGVQRLRRQGQHRARRILRMAKKVLVAAAILISVFFCLAMTNPSVRVTVIHTIMEWTGQDVGIHFQVSGIPLTELPEGYGPHYIPEGFIYQDEFSWKNPDGFSYGYEKEDGSAVLSIEVNTARNDSVRFLDNEHTIFNQITFHDTTAYLGTFQLHNGYVMLWVKDGIEHMVSLSGETVKLSDLIRIAENIY